MECVLLNEGIKFDFPVESLGSRLKDGEVVSVVKAELVREGVAFILFISKSPGDPDHRIFTCCSNGGTIPVPGIKALWEAKKETLRTFDEVELWIRDILEKNGIIDPMVLN